MLMFLLWHTLLIGGMLAIAFGLGYRLGRKKNDVKKNQIRLRF
jgi:hypothetical protein